MEDGEEGDKAWVKRPSSATGGTHASDVSHVLESTPHELFALLKHPATFEDHPHQSDGLLSAIRILLRHIQVVYKVNQLLARHWAVDTLGSLLYVCVETSQNVLGGSSRGEIDDEGASHLRIQRRYCGQGCCGFACPGFTHQK